MTIRLRRSVLFLPGSNARAIEKARTLDADAIIFDLEDAVAPHEKAATRAKVMAAIRQGGFGPREVIVRINELASEWARDDLAAAAEGRPDAVLLTKVGSVADVVSAASILDGAGAPATVRLWIMVETPAAITQINTLAQAAADPASRLDCFVLGVNDLARDMRVRLVPGRQPMLTWFSACIAAARCHGIDVLDGVYNQLDDPQGFRAECEQGRDFGFDGKTLIHPNQIAACNEVFSPGRDDLAWAKGVVQGFANPANADRGVIRVEGRMVERLHLDIAKRLLGLDEAIARRNQPAPSA